MVKQARITDSALSGEQARNNYAAAQAENARDEAESFSNIQQVVYKRYGSQTPEQMVANCGKDQAKAKGALVYDLARRIKVNATKSVEYTHEVSLLIRESQFDTGVRKMTQKLQQLAQEDYDLLNWFLSFWETVKDKGTLPSPWGWSNETKQLRKWKTQKLSDALGEFVGKAETEKNEMFALLDALHKNQHLQYRKQAA